MTASQRTKYTRRRAQIWEALHPTKNDTVPYFGKQGDDEQVEPVVPPVANMGNQQINAKLSAPKIIANIACKCE